MRRVFEKKLRVVPTISDLKSGIALVKSLFPSKWTRKNTRARIPLVGERLRAGNIPHTLKQTKRGFRLRRTLLWPDCFQLFERGPNHKSPC